MKPLLQKLPLSKNSSFLFERYESPYFETPWHYHEEFEIVLCDGGYGKKVVGNNTSEYQEGHLMLLGSNLPHRFRADDLFYESEKKPASIVIQFRMESFGDLFFELAEMQSVVSLFEKAKFGLEFFGSSREKINKILRSNIHKKGLERFVSLMEILKLMAESEQVNTICDIGMSGIGIKDSERMNIIFDQILKNFHEPILLEELAKKVNLSKEAFCRYFKARTQKTFVAYLNQIRINHACKLLKETEMSVLGVCYESGFNNLSNFNRQFAKQMAMNPRFYRKQML